MLLQQQHLNYTNKSPENVFAFFLDVERQVAFNNWKAGAHFYSELSQWVSMGLVNHSENISEKVPLR